MREIVICFFERLLGASTSGKSRDFGSRIPRFESWRPSQLVDQSHGLGIRGMFAVMAVRGR